MKRIRRAAAVLACLIMGTGWADAGLLIDAGPASNPQLFFGGDYVAGTEFTTTVSYTIRSLGWLDVEGDGLLFSHKIGLWNTGDQSLLASATVTSSSATLLSAQGTAVWYLEDIAPIVIGPGTYRVAGEVGPADHNALSGDKIGNGVTLTSGYVRTDFPNGGFNYPNLTFTSQAIRATLSTDAYQVAGVPEPSTLALVSVAGLFGAAYLARRRAAA